MSATAAAAGSLPDRIALEHAAILDSLPAGVSSVQARAASLEAFARLGIPGPREDAWKYANLRPLAQARFSPATTRYSPEEVRRLLPSPVESFARHVFVDGSARADLSSGDAPESYILHSSPRQPGIPARAPRTSPEQRFAWLNQAFATDVANIGVPSDIEMPARIELVFVATAAASEGASYPRVEVHVGEDSELCLIERHLSAPDAGNLVNSSVHLHLERGARCRHYRVQQLGAGAVWLDTLDAGVGEEAEYQLQQLTLGAESSRSTLAIELSAERAQLDFDAVALASDGQVQDAYAVVEHAAAHTVTRERFRGIAGARSRASFNGKIVVARGARGADSQQSLRGLIGGAQAEVDVRPQLEIYTDDVRCTHGATVGKLDEAMLFYLISRGLDPASAQHLLKRAFIADVIARIQVEPLRNELEAALQGRLE